MDYSEGKIHITPSLLIDPTELYFEFIKSSGPGGQNVNKVSTGVRLRFNILDSLCLPGEIKSRLFKIAKNRVNSEGYLIIESQKHRTQLANKKDLIEKFSELIKEATVKPKKRVKTRPSKKAEQKRLESKSRRSKLKQTRKKPEW